MNNETAAYLNEHCMIQAPKHRTNSAVHYDSLADMKAALDIADAEPTIKVPVMWREIDRIATNLYNSVTTFKRHPSYDSRANLLARANELSGAFHLALKLTGYNEPPTGTRQLVQDAREAVESLYKSKPTT